MTTSFAATAVAHYDGRSRPTLIAWTDVADRLARSGWSWLSTARPDGTPHLVPVFAAFDVQNQTALVAANARTRKAHNLRGQPRCVLARDAGDVHIVIEGDARPTQDLQHASTVFADQLNWPTTVTPDGLDALYGSPTSLGPPYQVWVIRPRQVFAFPTDGNTFAPTRFTPD